MQNSAAVAQKRTQVSTFGVCREQAAKRLWCAPLAGYNEAAGTHEASCKLHLPPGPPSPAFSAGTALLSPAPPPEEPERTARRAPTEPPAHPAAQPGTHRHHRGAASVSHKATPQQEWRRKRRRRGGRAQRPALTSAKKLSMAAPRPARGCAAPGPSRAPCAPARLSTTEPPLPQPQPQPQPRPPRRSITSQPGGSPQPLSARPLRSGGGGGGGGSRLPPPAPAPLPARRRWGRGGAGTGRAPVPIPTARCWLLRGAPRRPPKARGRAESRRRRAEVAGTAGSPLRSVYLRAGLPSGRALPADLGSESFVLACLPAGQMHDARCTRGSVYLCLREELCGTASSSREESQGRAAFCSRASPSTALGAGACELRHRRPALDARSNHEPATRLCKVLKTPRSPPGGTHLLEVPLISTPRYTAHAFLQLLQTHGLQRTAHEFTVYTVPTL